MKYCRSPITLCIQVCEWKGVGGPELCWSYLLSLKNEQRIFEMIFFSWCLWEGNPRILK